MKVVGILGSPRGKNSLTRRLLESALAGTGELGAETELIDVTKLDIKGCLGCNACYKTGTCVLKDDFADVYEKMRDADGIILGSPVYFDAVSAQLKAFIDRTADCRHCQQLVGKYGMAVTATASSGADETLKQLNDFMTKSGAFTIGGVKVVISSPDYGLETGTKKAVAMGIDLAEAIQTKRQYPEQARLQKAFIKGFSFAVVKNREKWPGEYEYYKAKGWI